MKQYEERTMRFLLSWIGSSVVVWPAAIFACLILFSAFWIVVDLIDVVLLQLAPAAPWQTIGLLVLGVVPGLAIGFVVGNLQDTLLSNHFGLPAYRWSRRTILGSTSAGVLVVLLAFFTPGDLLANYWEIIAFPVFMVIVSVAQWSLLRRDARHAWMWVLANAAAGIVFVGLMSMNQPSRDLVWYPFLQIGLWLLAAAAQGAITGIVMLWLFDHRDSEWDDKREKAPVYVEVYNRDERRRR